MFVKLNQRSTSWWLCVMMTSVLSVCVLTVLVYPVYADLCGGSCNSDNCGPNPPAPDCGHCDDDFDVWESYAGVVNVSKWSSGGTCYARLNTFHRTNAHNDSNNERSIDLSYNGIVRLTGGFGICNVSTFQPVEGTLVVPAGETRTNTLLLSRVFTLSAVGENCTYDAQAVSEYTFVQTGLGGDWHSTCAAFNNCGM